ncbi:GAF domain [Plasmopara halstedii]|uniref:GAF domain n=1 Tax=Plasmopara halstedii TaxID=4781 RepID=A0A0P1AS51_PLAHL|nr:GAF domain [Plasmopara halstedii]CEG44655.1 GAF domain [Plasmopara halstedii]|eukprot:XP_024581024.1 GAF domain [Plasmopara halstedii]
MSNSSTSSSQSNELSATKARQRRLLSLAHGITNLPELIRRRRFGVQVPVNFETVQTTNSRCPCCTHSLAPVKMSIFKAASVLAKKRLRSFKMDTRRCYLCGYLVCIDCWSAEYMERTVGRVVAIVVCTRCHANVQACDYSEVSDSRYHHGPVKVVEDPSDDSAAPLLIDFLQASLMNVSTDHADRAAILSVIRMLLHQNKEYSSDDEDSSDYDDSDHVTMQVLDKFLRNKEQLPDVASCKLTSAEHREYLIDLPVDPSTMVPSSVIPSHDNVRLRLANDKGLLQLAHQLAPLDSSSISIDQVCDVRDLDLLCQLAVRAMDCSNAFVTVMGINHNHVLATTNPGFQHAVVPREQTICQHTIMTTSPFVATHPEADVRFHKIMPVKALSIRFYVGFPVLVSKIDDSGNEFDIPVGTLCCTDSTARGELTRTQYRTMEQLTNTASRLIQLKAKQLQDQTTKLDKRAM